MLAPPMDKSTVEQIESHAIEQEKSKTLITKLPEYRQGCNRGRRILELPMG